MIKSNLIVMSIGIIIINIVSMIICTHDDSHDSNQYDTIVMKICIMIVMIIQ
jgi:hypothetical protein